MPTSLLCVTFDCHDPPRLAAFWATALSYRRFEQNDDGAEVGIEDPIGEGPDLYFMRVPEAKSVKNRVHLDLEPEIPLEQEVARLVAAGAREVSSHRDPSGFTTPYRWIVMQDPEGNEFCVAEPLEAGT
jgi:hypothetical protein